MGDDAHDPERVENDQVAEPGDRNAAACLPINPQTSAEEELEQGEDGDGLRVEGEREKLREEGPGLVRTGGREVLRDGREPTAAVLGVRVRVRLVGEWVRFGVNAVNEGRIGVEWVHEGEELMRKGVLVL